MMRILVLVIILILVFLHAVELANVSDLCWTKPIPIFDENGWASPVHKMHIIWTSSHLKNITRGQRMQVITEVIVKRKQSKTKKPQKTQKTNPPNPQPANTLPEKQTHSQAELGTLRIIEESPNGDWSPAVVASLW